MAAHPTYNEYLDTVEAERAKRKPRKRRRLTVASVSETAAVHDEVFQRVRSVLCDESPVDLDEHAALITLEVYRAQESRRFPPRREQPDFTEGPLAKGEVGILAGQLASASPSASDEGAVT